MIQQLMRTLKLAEKQNNLKSLISTIQPTRNYKYSLPIISERNQSSSVNNNNIVSSWQSSPKIFINSEEALVWIKKDVDRRSRHDFFEMIKRRAEKQFTIQKHPSLPAPMLDQRSKRNYNSHTVRKYSSTSRCQKGVQKSARGTFNLIEKFEKSSRKIKQNVGHFLNIRIVKASAAPQLKTNIKDRFKTEKSSHSVKNADYKQDKSIKSTHKAKSEGKFTCKKLQILDNFDNEYLSPW